MSSTALHLNAIRKTYQEAQQQRLILDRLSLSLSEPTAISILGRSGSGKSTLLNIMAGLDNADAGEVWLADNAMHTMTEKQRTYFRRQHIGFIFQFFNLLPTLTVSENLQLPIHLARCDSKATRYRLQDMLYRLDLQDRLQDYPDTLSGGEQQRVAIIRALVHRPRWIFADEPTGNLDEETGNQVLALLLEFVAEYRATLVLVTHSSELAQRTNEQWRLSHGQLIANH